MGSAVTVSTGTGLALLEVTGGVHRSVAAPVEQPNIRIGAGGDCDIMLSDEGVADEHAMLRFERGTVFVEARGADVGLGRHVIPRGQGCKARLPAELTVGSSSIRLARPDGAKFDIVSWLQAHAAIVGAAAVVVMLFAATQADAIKAMSGGAQQSAAETAAAAVAIARKIAEALDYVGVFAVELFLVDGPTGERVVVNEIAPRVHNSGHWTEAACALSQFELHIRCIAGLPLVTTRRHSDCVMENLIGDDMDKVPALVAEDGVVVHLYGKAETRPGRKMGHFTRLKPLTPDRK